MGSRWIDALSEGGGPLTEAARAFDRQRGPFDRGPAGLRALTAAVEDAELATEEEDRRFVEGAGALLALLLLDHVGEGGHRLCEGRHRLKLGRRGFFDPFGAVEAALDADEPRRELARQVSFAEAEARGEGPVSRVATAFERALARAHPDRAITDQRELQVTLDDGVEVDLERLARVAETGDPKALDHAADRLVGLLPGTGATPSAIPFEEAAPRLLPRLVGEAFFEGLQDGTTLCAARIGHDLHVALVVAYEGRSRYLRRDEIDGWNLTPAEALRAAVRNLASRSGAARFGRVESEDGPLVVARTGDGHDASRLLLPGLFEVLAAELERPILVAVPHRDVLMAASGARPRAAEALATRARDAAARAPHRISESLFEVRPAGVVPWS